VSASPCSSAAWAVGLTHGAEVLTTDLEDGALALTWEEALVPDTRHDLYSQMVTLHPPRRAGRSSLTDEHRVEIPVLKRGGELFIRVVQRL
jgi:hypothetical protein